MRFAERTLLLLFLIGYYFAILKARPDVSILFVSAALLALLYALGMPLLLAGGIWKSVRGLSLEQWCSGILFGLFAGYFVFSIAYHSLGQMDSLALAENGGLGIVVFGGYSLIRMRRAADQDFYRIMGLRVLALLAVLLLSLAMRYALHGRL